MKRREAYELATRIVEQFNKLLNRKEIRLPSEREDLGPPFRCIPHFEYGQLHDVVTHILVKHRRPKRRRRR